MDLESIRKNHARLPKLLTYIFSFVTSLFVFPQHEKHKIVGDFNKDGFKDTLRWYYDGGSGFGGNYYTLINGKSKEKFEIDTWACFCVSWGTIPVPPGLLKPENKGLMDTLTVRMFSGKRENPEATLQWIMDAIKSKRTLPSHPLFDLYFQSPPHWENISEKADLHYYLELAPTDFAKVYFPDGDKNKWYKKNESKGWLYYSAYHFRSNEAKFSGATITAADSGKGYKVFITPHAVILQKGDKQCWPFISDHYTTGTPDKLRWRSIKSAKMFDNYLVVERELPHDIFIVNTTSGGLARLKCDSWAENMVYLDGQLQFDCGGKKTAFVLKDLFSELDKLNNN